MSEEKDYKKLYEDLLQEYEKLLADISDIGFQIQLFAKNKKPNNVVP